MRGQCRNMRVGKFKTVVERYACRRSRLFIRQKWRGYGDCSFTTPYVHSLFERAAQPAVKVIAYLVSCAFAGISLLLAYRCSASDLNALEYKNVLLCLALCLVPLATPYLFFYDLSVMTLLWATADSAHRNLRSLFVSCALLTNLYAIVVVVPSLAKLATPWLLLLIYLEMYRRVLLINWRKKPGELTAPPTRATDAAY